MSKRPAVLMIFNGYGLNNSCDHGVVCGGKTPVMNQLMSQCPSVKGEASRMTVGLPEGRMGNSGVRHLNMGAGRIVYRELTRITKPIQDGDFLQVPEFLAAAEGCRKDNSALHMSGFMPDDGVHSHNTHIYGFLDLAKGNGLKRVYVHCSLDGRDTSPELSKEYAAVLEAKMKETGVGGVVSVMRRYYAMDRSERWDRTELIYSTLTKGRGNTASNVIEGTRTSHDADKADEFVVPFVVEEDGKPTAVIGDRDSVIFYNPRSDRAREITRTFYDNDFDGSARDKKLDLMSVCFTGYDKTIENKLVALKEEGIASTFGKFLAAHDKTQIRIDETEKYVRATLFFDDGVKEPNPGEDRILVPSPRKVATRNLKPKMSVLGACDKLVEATESDEYDVVIINFANPDMARHTGMEGAAIKTIEIVDVCVGYAVGAIKKADGVMSICANHGNAEQLVGYETGEPFTVHTTNPVSLIPVNANPSYKLCEGGTPCDVIPILIQLMGTEQPGEMTGTSLLIKQSRNLSLPDVEHKTNRK